MKNYVRTAGALFAAASLTALPGPALAAQEFDQATYDLLLDCATLQIIFASNGSDEAAKKDSVNMGVAFISAAQLMSGVEIGDLGAVVKPRQARIMGQIASSDPAATRLTRSCGAILKVGINYKDMGK